MALHANCVSMDVQILTQRGVLRHNEVRIGDMTIGCNLTTGRSEWTRIMQIHHTKVPVPTIQLGNAYWKARATPDHRWLTKKKFSDPKHYGKHEFRVIDEFDWATMISHSEPFDGNGLLITDDEAELIGWVLSDGSIHKWRRKDGSIGFSLYVCQAKEKYVKHLEYFFLRISNVKHESRKKERKLPIHIWNLNSQYSMDLFDRAGLVSNKGDGAIKFVLSLNRSQLERFMEAIWMAEGVSQGRNGRGHSQKPGLVADAFEIGVYLLGYRPARCKRSSLGLDRWTWAIPRMRAKKFIISDERNEPVWCVTTELGSWTAKTESSMFLTGNTNMDLPENKRSETIKGLEAAYDEVIDAISGDGEIEITDEMSETQEDFMRAAKRGQAMIAPPIMPGEQEIGNLPG